MAFRGTVPPVLNPVIKRKENIWITSASTSMKKAKKSGHMDRIIGRDKEIYRVEQILSRRQKNNPCLIGEPGCR